jgi:transposase
MLAGSDRQQGFFDAAWCAGLVAENSIYSLLAKHGDRIVRDEDFAECYSARWGRPSIAPSLLAKVLLLAYRNGLSDRRAMEALRFDLRWKVALDLPIDHPGFHHTSLVKFRARLLLHGKERIVFERSLELASELGLLEGPLEQIVDSTPMLGAAAIQDTVTLVRAAVRKLIDAVGALDPRAARRLRKALAFDYARPRETPAVDWQDKPAREAMLVRVAKDAQRALQTVDEADVMSADSVREAAGLLAEIVGQEFDTTEDEDSTRPPDPADHLRPRSRDASRPQDQRAALHRLQAARRDRDQDAAADRDRDLAGQRTRRPPRRRPGRTTARSGPADQTAGRHRLRQR